MDAELDAVNRHRYVALTTFRRTGEGVATPVWIARDGDQLVFVSMDNVGKTKRLARDPRVELRPCSVRGQVPPNAPTWSGTAQVVRGAGEIASIRRALGRKYLLARLGDLFAKLPFGRSNKPRAGIRITLSS